MSKKFIEAPVKGILGELGFETYEAFAEKAGKSVLFLDGFDELCMIDGMTDFAEQILSEIIRGFSESHNNEAQIYRCIKTERGGNRHRHRLCIVKAFQCTKAGGMD